MLWNFFPFKGDLVLGKARSCRVPNLSWRGAESPEWSNVLPKKLYMRCEAGVGTLSWWSCQSPVSYSCGLPNHLNSFHRGMFKLNSKSDADSSLYSLSHFEWNGTTVRMLTQQHLPPHRLVQWNRYCSCMSIPVHTPWLPGHVDVT